jgi:signal transduction histidine kinase
MPSEPVFGNVDATQLSMVVENLLENASHYSPEDTEIALKLRVTPKKIEIDVTDQGVGIPEEQMSKLFQKFSRLPNEFSVQVGGTGLGLYWASKIVKLHKGRINVSSRLGKGSTFTIALPSS